MSFSRSALTLRLFNGFFFIAFVLSTLVQYNDPDATLWIAIYGAAALSCAFQYVNRLNIAVPIALTIVSVIWIGTLLPTVIHTASWSDVFDSLTMKTKAVEEAREAGGLMIVAVWAAITVGVHYRRREQSQRQHGHRQPKSH